MSALLASVAAYTLLFTLLVAGVEHLSRPAALAEALTTHRLLPAPRSGAVAVIAGEGLLAGTGVVALYGTGTPRLLTAFLLGGALLLGLYAGYGSYLMSTGRTGPCGCSRQDLPMDGWVVTRAAILAILALVAVLLSGLAPAGAIIVWQRVDESLAVVRLAAATVTALRWHLPAAMYQPPPAAGPGPLRPARTAEGNLPG